ncbi:MAG: HAD hydrolase family protein [Planctomycetaceae bacterium]|jgi:YrbI family 3-deoxy-D-manno-octulosonate 8-phosphate phosphatase|nr:HAD hydrolase family protein [Planctomycetaceae bacterium]
MELEKRCKAVRLILSDVDGILTDGTVAYDNQGIESKRFHVRDGLGIRLWQQTGGQFGLVTGRSSQIVRMRAAELDIAIVRQGVSQKRDAVLDIMRTFSLERTQICFIGDDFPDLPVLRHAGLAVTVPEAAAEIRENAHYVTNCRGGQGVVREVIELILKHQRRWENVIQQYLV